MPQSVTDLERERAKLLTEISRLRDLRPGCITGIVRAAASQPVIVLSPAIRALRAWESPGH
jgi:hypothetical protein